MKKLFVILLTLALMLTLIGNVSASNQLFFDDNGGVPIVTPVDYHMSPTYMITVPSGIHFTGGNPVVYDWVNATNLVLAAGAWVNVSVRSEHGGKMYAHYGGGPVGAGLDYELYLRDVGEDEFSNTEVSLSNTDVNILEYQIPSVDVGAIEKRIELKFELDDISNNDNMLSGTYKDVLTFTASYSGNSI